MKVLIVRLSAIGDVIQGIPCLVALKESFPDWEISWLVEENSAPVLQGHPYLKKLFVLKRDWRKKKQLLFPSHIIDGICHLQKVQQNLREEHFDIAIDLQGLFKSGLWTWLSHAPRRIGHNKTREFAHYFLNEFVSDRPTFDPSFPLIQRYLEPAQYLGADITKGRYLLPPATRETITAVDAFLAIKDPKTPIIAISPWSLWPSKNLPLETWREVISILSKDFFVLIVGANTDPNINPLIQQNSHVLDLVGKTSLSILSEVFRRCHVVIGPDSGPLHLANATGIPRILMIFGSTSWRRSGPQGKNHQSISLDLSCQPCFERICPLGHLNCLKLIDSKRILETVYQLASFP